MEKRVVLAVVLCVAAMFLWMKFNPPPTPVPPAVPVATASVPTPGAAAGAGTTPAGTVPGAAPAAADEPEKELTLVSKDQEEFVFSSFGGTLKHARLLEAKYLDHPGDASTGHDVVTTPDLAQASLW